MFKMASMERRLVENPLYMPIRISMVRTPIEQRAMQVAVEREQARKERVAAAESVAESEYPVLEERIKKCCDFWIILNTDKPCSPTWISQTMGDDQKTGNITSPGAIDAVFKRWERIGFAVISYKPTRFVNYTAEGARLGPAAMREKARLARREYAPSKAGRV